MTATLRNMPNGHRYAPQRINREDADRHSVLALLGCDGMVLLNDVASVFGVEKAHALLACCVEAGTIRTPHPNFGFYPASIHVSRAGWC